jgi:hypothetical protein
MRILANENFPREAVEALRTRGHDVLWAAALLARGTQGPQAYKTGLPYACGGVGFVLC